MDARPGLNKADEVNEIVSSSSKNSAFITPKMSSVGLAEPPSCSLCDK
jgi:hypothetical protein